MNNEPNISLYGDGAGEDFPVLKAFQQYIDAEQAKARRRLLTVSIIFTVVVIAVIAIFSALVISANNRTQAANDKLLEIVLNGKDRSYDDGRAAATQEARINALNETLARLQRSIDGQDGKSVSADRLQDEIRRAATELNQAKPAVATPSVDPLLAKRQQEAEAKLQKTLEQLKAEKQKLAEEKEKRRQEELERYRREHYPEYYAKKEAEAKAKERAKLKLDELDEVSYDDFDDEEELPTVHKYEEDLKPVKVPVKTDPKDIDLDGGEAVEYFSEGGEDQAKPVKNGKKSGWRLPMD